MKIGPIERSRKVLWYGLPSPLAPGIYEDRIYDSALLREYMD